MARIPRYDEQQQVGGLPGTARASGFSPLGQALKEAGQIGQDFAAREFRRAEVDEAKLREREDRKATLDATIALDAVQRDMMTLARERQAALKGDPDGYASAIDAALVERGDKLVEQFPNERAQQTVRAHLSSMRTRMWGEAKAWEAQRAVEYDAGRVSNMAGTMAADLAGDPSQYVAYRALTDEAINAARATEPQREKMRDARDRQFRLAAVEGNLARDPNAVLQAVNARLGVEPVSVNLKDATPAGVAALLSDLTGQTVTPAVGAGPVTLALSGADRSEAVRALSAAIGIEAPAVTKGEGKPSGVPWIDALEPDELARVRAAAMTRVAQGQQGERSRIQQRDQDAAALASQGKPDPAPLPVERYVAAFGPEEGARRHAEASKVQVYASDRAALRGMPLPEMEALVAARGPTGVEGASGDVSRQASLARAVNDEVQAREADGPGYVVKSSPVVARAADAVFGVGANGQPRWLDMTIPAADRAAAMQGYIAQSVGEQQRLGIRKVQMLPAEAEAYIVRAAASVTMPGANGQAPSGDRMAAVIAGLAETFGSYWPAVHAQVVGGKNGASVPDSFIVLPGVASLPGREEVARLEGVKIEDQKKQAEAVRSGAGKDVETKVGEALAPFFAAMMPTATNSRTGEAITKVATKLALARVIGGMKPSDAATAAANVLLGDLSFPTDASTRPYMVPKAQDVAAVTAGARAAIDRVGLWNLPAPPDMTGARSDEDASAVWSQAIQARPQWVTNGDQTGLLLYTTGENGRAVPVKWKDGRQVSFKWDELRALAAESRTGPGSAVTSPALNYRRP
jgi:hypothetical protein